MDGGCVSQPLLNKLAQEVVSRTPELVRLDQYYTGTQPLAFLHPETVMHVGDRLTSLAINWPRVIVGSVEERLDVEGFRLGKDASADEELTRIWQANDLDEWSGLVHVDAMVHGRAFVTVWGDNDGQPRISAESARQMTVQFVPGTRTVASAVKVWTEDISDIEPRPYDMPSGVKTVERAVLYLPQVIVPFVRASAGTGSWASTPWVELPAIPNPLGEVPVVPFVNRPRLTNLLGESELSDILPLADAVNKLATDMMVSSEYHAVGRRWATGIEVPRRDADKQKLQEEVRRYWDEATKGKTWLAGTGVNFGQFPEASLDNFVGAIRLFTGQIAAIAGLPPHYLGQSSDNPASADAIRSAESSLVMKAKRKQRGFGGSWERVMRLALKVTCAETDASAMETIWRNPSTPTPAQLADAAVKLTQGDRPVITIGQARVDLGYTQGEITRMAEEDEKQLALAATADVRAKLDLARQLQSEGLSQQAAYAAVGLLAAASAMSNTAPAITS
jgi:hypothetical protein